MDKQTLQKQALKFILGERPYIELPEFISGLTNEERIHFSDICNYICIDAGGISRYAFYREGETELYPKKKEASKKMDRVRTALRKLMGYSYPDSDPINL